MGIFIYIIDDSADTGQSKHGNKRETQKVRD
jgi:hypothetical protein